MIVQGVLETTPASENGRNRLKQYLKENWKGMLLVLAPILASLIFINGVDRKEYRCLWLVIVMAIFWLTEALPMPVTSMLPMICLPLMGILSTDQTCMQYFKGNMVLFIGGIMIALAVEYCNLHQRMALKIIQIVGCSPRRLHLGTMICTAFVSMWINNTASVSMICPIMTAIIEQLERQGICKMYLTTADGRKRPSKITLCYFLGAAYSGTLGGFGTLNGSGANITFKGIFESRFPNGPTIDFPQWMFYNFFGMVITIFGAWIWLQFLFMGLWRPNSEEGRAYQLAKDNSTETKTMIDSRYKELGPMSSHEMGVGLLFILSALLFFFRSPGFIPGWETLFEDYKTIKINDGSSAMFVVVLCFVIPADWSFLTSCFRKNGDKSVKKPDGNYLVSWRFIQKKTPWGLIFLLGGGFAIAEASQVSGMSEMIGRQMEVLKVLPPFYLVLVVCIVCQAASEISSNIAMGNILLPVLAEMAIAVEVNPLYLMFPAALSISCAFHLPVGTPPNAIVAMAANIPTKDMAVAGIGPTIITLLCIWLLFPTWGQVIFPGLDEFPEWAVNATRRMV